MELTTQVVNAATPLNRCEECGGEMKREIRENPEKGYLLILEDTCAKCGHRTGVALKSDLNHFHFKAGARRRRTTKRTA